MNFFTKWINMLRGKSVESSENKDRDEAEKKQQPKAPEKEEKSSQDADYYFQGANSSEDSVVQDLKTAEKFAKQVVEKVKKAPIPLPQLKEKMKQGVQQDPSAQEVTKVKQQPKLSNELLGKVIRLTVILVLIIILVFVLFSLYRMLRQNGGIDFGNGEVPVEQTTPSPTPVTYKPYIPSVYAKDPEILQIEEDVSVLDAELFRTNIGDPLIKPPSLDFNIRF